MIDAPWPTPRRAGAGVFAGEPPRARVEVLEPARRAADRADPPLPPLEPAPPFDPKGRRSSKR